MSDSEASDGRLHIDDCSDSEKTPNHNQSAAVSRTDNNPQRKTTLSAHSATCPPAHEEPKNVGGKNDGSAEAADPNTPTSQAPQMGKLSIETDTAHKLGAEGRLNGIEAKVSPSGKPAKQLVSKATCVSTEAPLPGDTLLSLRSGTTTPMNISVLMRAGNALYISTKWRDKEYFGVLVDGSSSPPPHIGMLKRHDSRDTDSHHHQHHRHHSHRARAADHHSREVEIAPKRTRGLLEKEAVKKACQEGNEKVEKEQEGQSSTTTTSGKADQLLKEFPESECLDGQQAATGAASYVRCAFPHCDFCFESIGDLRLHVLLRHGEKKKVAHESNGTQTTLSSLAQLSCSVGTDTADLAIGLHANNYIEGQPTRTLPHCTSDKLAEQASLELLFSVAKREQVGCRGLEETKPQTSTNVTAASAAEVGRVPEPGKKLAHSGVKQQYQQLGKASKQTPESYDYTSEQLQKTEARPGDLESSALSALSHLSGTLATSTPAAVDDLIAGILQQYPDASLRLPSILLQYCQQYNMLEAPQGSSVGSSAHPQGLLPAPSSSSAWQQHPAQRMHKIHELKTLGQPQHEVGRPVTASSIGDPSPSLGGLGIMHARPSSIPATSSAFLHPQMRFGAPLYPTLLHAQQQLQQPPPAGINSSAPPLAIPPNLEHGVIASNTPTQLAHSLHHSREAFPPSFRSPNGGVAEPSGPRTDELASIFTPSQAGLKL